MRHRGPALRGGASACGTCDRSRCPDQLPRRAGCHADAAHEAPAPVSILCIKPEKSRIPKAGQEDHAGIGTTCTREHPCSRTRSCSDTGLVFFALSSCAKEIRRTDKKSFFSHCLASDCTGERRLVTIEAPTLFLLPANLIGREEVKGRAFRPVPSCKLGISQVYSIQNI